MKILSFESSAVSAAVCLTDGQKLVAASFQNCGLTHSRTLLPMAEQLLDNVGLTPRELDGFAVAAGPGSFTGIRIGVATVKGLSFGTDKPCVGVSTLEAMAYNLIGMTGTVSCVMDARAGQVYNARFRLNGTGAPERLTPGRALTIAALGEEIAHICAILSLPKRARIWCLRLPIWFTPALTVWQWQRCRVFWPGRRKPHSSSTRYTCASRRPSRCGTDRKTEVMSNDHCDW